MAVYNLRSFLLIILLGLLTISACDRTPVVTGNKIQLISAKVNNESILGADPEVASADHIVLIFSTSIANSSISDIHIIHNNEELNDFTPSFLDNNKIINLELNFELEEGEVYTLVLPDNIKGENDDFFSGSNLNFRIKKTPLTITSITHNDKELSTNLPNYNIGVTPQFQIRFSHPLDLEELKSKLYFVGDSSFDLIINTSNNIDFTATVDGTLTSLSKYTLFFPSSLGNIIDRDFTSQTYTLHTDISDQPVFPLMDDEDLLTLVQEQTFKYFWDFGHPVSGLSRERNTSGDIVTSGGSGFGLMSMIVGVERGFITREQAVERWSTIVDFLEKADRFHGAWSHWLNGVTGKVVPFGFDDNGGDLVETAFLVQGLLTVRQYLDQNNAQEAEIITKINTLWEAVEWDWYRQNDQNVLYWHWSPNFGWQKNLAIRGHNETQIVYTLAAASPTHSIPKIVYTEGYANNGGMVNGNNYFGINLPVGYAFGGPLFFSHYSYLGMDPRNLQDQYANYWTQNVNHSAINQAYCIENPKNFLAYSADCWGITASDNHQGYNAHSPTNDLGVITPTAAISSIPYTPEASLAAIRHFYYYLGDRLWGPYGFYDAFNPTESWWANSYLAIDQGPIICMIENYRTGLLWDLYMSAPEVKIGLDKLGFTY